MKNSRKRIHANRPINYDEDYGFLGHMIYSERKILGISKERVAIDLNLSSYIIENLETGHFNRTPGLSYMTGFLRTYAEYLGLNPQELIRYIRPVETSVFEEETVLKVPFQQRQLPSPRILWGAVFILILMLVGYSSPLFQEDHPSPLHAVTLDDRLTTSSCIEEDTIASLQNFLNIYHKPFLPKTSDHKTF